MARTKKTTEDTKNVSFDYNEALNELKIDKTLKSGFQDYIEVNNITIKSENDLTKQLEVYLKSNAGV